MADTTAPAEHADRPAKPRLWIDAKWIVTTGIGIGLLLLTLVGMMFQQNAMLMQQYATLMQQQATINARIDDTNANVSTAQIEIRELRNQMHTEIRALRTEMQTEMREMREMRSLLLQLLERTAPATAVD